MSDEKSDPTPRYIALFEAVASSPANAWATLTLHDHDGIAVSALKVWAESRSFAIKERDLELDGVRWKAHEIEFNGMVAIAVHDVAKASAKAES